MTTKNNLKSIIEKFFEESLVSSEYMTKLIKTITTFALEVQNIVNAVTIINDRLNQHEQLLLNLVNLQKEKKDVVDYSLKPTQKTKPSKPN